jgi:hypothetical protein
MRRWIALLLALGMLLSLCACGGTEEAKPVEQPEETPSPAALVEQQIDALGVIGLDSKDAIEAAEAAWAALSPAEQAEVHNYAVLQAARLVYDDAAAKQAAADAEAARLAAMEPFVGTWVKEWPDEMNYNYVESFSLNSDGSYLNGSYSGEWSLDPSNDQLIIDGTTWIVFQEDGFTKIRMDDGSYSYAFVLEQDLEQAREKKYVVADITIDNVRSYFGDAVFVGDLYNNFGEIYEKGYIRPSLLYPQGLVIAGYNYAEIRGNSWSSNISIIIHPFEENYRQITKIGLGAKILYIRQSYVAENSAEYDPESIDWGTHYLILTSGERFPVSSWPKYIDYNDFKF